MNVFIALKGTRLFLLIICRLIKINSVSFVYYSLLVFCFHGIHFTETIYLCEGVEPY